MTPFAAPDLFKTPTGRAVIVAMDHGIADGVAEGLESPLTVLRTVLPAGPDGVLLGPGMARHAAVMVRQAGAALWITMDHYGTSTLPGGNEGLELRTVIATAAYARDLGAAGVKTVLVFGYADPQAYLANVRSVGMLAEDAHRAGLPLMVEAVLWGRRIPDDRRDDPGLLAHACRIAAELGADLIKTTLPRAHLRGIVDALPVPVVILGGPGTNDHHGFLERIADAIQQGARGVVVGRKVWQADDPAGAVRALRAVVHSGRPATEIPGA